MQLKGRPKGTKVSKQCSNIKIWGARKTNFVRVSFVRQSCKHGHGPLVGLTNVKVTSVENFSSFVDKSCKKWFLEFVGLTWVKGTSVRKNVANESVRCPSQASSWGKSLAYFG